MARNIVEYPVTHAEQIAWLEVKMKEFLDRQEREVSFGDIEGEVILSLYNLVDRAKTGGSGGLR